MADVHAFNSSVVSCVHTWLAISYTCTKCIKLKKRNIRSSGDFCGVFFLVGGGGSKYEFKNIQKY